MGKHLENIRYKQIKKGEPLNAFKLFISYCLALLLLPVTAMAGIYIHSVDQFKDTDKSETSKVFIEKDRMRVESGGSSENNLIIFRGDKEVFWVINIDKKTYNEMTREDLEKLRAKMDNAFKEMEEQLKNLPPEQRKMMEQMMPKQAQMAMQRPAKTIYKKIRSGEKVNQWSCILYEGFEEGIKTKDVWTADFSQLNINPDDLKGLNAMGKFFEVLTQEIEELYMIGPDQAEKEGGFSGIPVKTIESESGNIIQITELKEITSKSFDSAIFELPSGLKKEKGPWGE